MAPIAGPRGVALSTVRTYLMAGAGTAFRIRRVPRAKIAQRRWPGSSVSVTHGAIESASKPSPKAAAVDVH